MKKRKYGLSISRIDFGAFILLVIILLHSCRTSDGHDLKGPPNIIVILVDDMGFSDMGCYCSEIATPNIDKLGVNGLRFTQFYNASRCCASRASLLTGLYPHQVGVGGMVDTHGRTRTQGPWKLVSMLKSSWELYDLDSDRSELNDISKSFPDKVLSMEEQYNACTAEVGVKK